MTDLRYNMHQNTIMIIRTATVRDCVWALGPGVLYFIEAAVGLRRRVLAKVYVRIVAETRGTEVPNWASLQNLRRVSPMCSRLRWPCYHFLVFSVLSGLKMQLFHWL